MAALEQQRMSFGGTDITFPRTVNYAEPTDWDHIIHKPKDQSTVIYKRGFQVEFEVDVICTKAEADTTIRAWITSRSLVVFIPAFTTAPGVTYNTIILNREFSIKPWSQGKWRGTLRLRKQ